MGITTDDSQAGVPQGLPHAVFIARRDEHHQLVPGVPGGGTQDLHPGQLQLPGEVVVEPARGDIQIGMAGDHGQAGPDEGRQQVAAGAVLPHVFQGLIEERVVGQEQLGAPVGRFGDNGRSGLQGHQDGLDGLAGVSHFEPHPVAAHGPGRWIVAFQQVDNIFKRRTHRT